MKRLMSVARNRSQFRIRRVFDAVDNNGKVTALVTQLPWARNLITLTQPERPNPQGMLVGSPGVLTNVQCQVDRVVHQLTNQLTWARHA